jgi:hypothetical protein
MSTADVNENRIEKWVSVVLDRNSPWRDRQKAAENIGVLARKLRRTATLDKLLNKLAKFPNFQDNLLDIATGPDVNEPLRRAAAWTLSQLNDWPDYFNERVLDDKQLESHTTIDASLAFLPELGYANAPPVSEQLETAKKFLPHLDGKGFELRWDTKNHYVGPFFRVLQHPDDDTRRCIEYIYVWSRQVWPISGFFTYYFWPLLSFMALIPWSVGGLLGWSGNVSLGLVLVLFGSYRTLHPREMRCFKNDTWYIGGGILLLLASLLPALWAFVIPIVSAIGLFVLRRYILGETEHIMDYAPVFVYLKRKGSDWQIARARIDRFHYDTTELGFNDLYAYVSGETLFLETDNIWRSFKFAKVHGKHERWSYYGYVAMWSALYLITAIAVAAAALPKVFFLAESQWGGFWLVAWSLGATLAIIGLNEVATTPISDSGFRAFVSPRFIEQLEKHVLDQNKLVHLWNMVDDKANLVIRKKLQNPFRTASDRSYWRSFRDPTAEALAYEAMQRVQHLRRNDGTMQRTQAD